MLPYTPVTPCQRLDLCVFIETILIEEIMSCLKGFLDYASNDASAYNNSISGSLTTSLYGLLITLVSVCSRGRFVSGYSVVLHFFFSDCGLLCFVCTSIEVEFDHGR